MRLSKTTAGCLAAVALAAVPTPALAGSGGFTDYRQATADQYGQESAVAGSSQDGTVAGASAAKPTKTTAAKPKSPSAKHKNSAAAHKKAVSKHPSSSGTAPAGASGTAPGSAGVSPVSVARPSRPVSLGRGSLPFTGGALGALALIGVALLAAGCLMAAVLRVRRPRRTPGTSTAA